MNRVTKKHWSERQTLEKSDFCNFVGPDGGWMTIMVMAIACLISLIITVCYGAVTSNVGPSYSLIKVEDTAFFFGSTSSGGLYPLLLQSLGPVAISVSALIVLGSTMTQRRAVKDEQSIEYGKRHLELAVERFESYCPKSTFINRRSAILDTAQLLLSANRLAIDCATLKARRTWLEDRAYFQKRIALGLFDLDLHKIKELVEGIRNPEEADKDIVTSMMIIYRFALERLRLEYKFGDQFGIDILTVAALNAAGRESHRDFLNDLRRSYPEFVLEKKLRD